MSGNANVIDSHETKFVDDRIGDAASRNVTVNETPHLADSNQTTVAENSINVCIEHGKDKYSFPLNDKAKVRDVKEKIEMLSKFSIARQTLLCGNRQPRES